MTAAKTDCSIDFHLFGELDFDRCLRLRRRLVYEAETVPSGRMVVLICEHSNLITIGRSGSRAHIRRSDAELEREQLMLRWVHRSGGCIPHAAGQLAVYAVLNTDAGNDSDGSAGRLAVGMQQALAEVSVTGSLCDAGVVGRTGLLAAVGTRRQDHVITHSAFVNVCPSMNSFRFVDSWQGSPQSSSRSMSCLLAERRLPVRMSSVRSAVVAGLVSSFQCDRHHIHTGHPWLPAEGSSLARAC